MSDPPAKPLSGATSCSERRGSKFGGYAGVFFQLFDWNRKLNGKRLLPHKPLPTERPPKRGIRRRKDEKLPMAKLLLIANENRGGFPKLFSGDVVELQVFDKEKTPEKKSRRSPSVVAKLMGLETMPSPEPCKDKNQGKQEIQTNTEAAPSSKPCNDRKQETGSAIKTCTAGGKLPSENPSILSQSLTTVNLSKALDATATKPPRALVCHKSDDPKITFFCKLPSLSPRKTESTLRSILSPSKAHNKLLSPIKSPLATKRGARLLEAAAKILEPNMQPSPRVRGLGINSKAAARSLLDSNADLEEEKFGTTVPRSKRKPLMPIDTKKQQQNVSLCVYSDQSKPPGRMKSDKKSLHMDANVAYKIQAPLTGKRGSPAASIQEGLRKSGATKEESVSLVGPAGPPRLMRSKSVREEPEPGKSGMGHHNDLKNVKEEKGKSELAKQKQTSNRLSQPRLGVKKREMGNNTMDAKHEIENKDPNVSTLFNKGDDRRSVSADLAGGNSRSSSILSYGKLFSSRKSATSHDATRNNQKKGDSSVMKSLLRKKGPARDSLTKSHLKSEKTDKVQLSSNCKSNESGLTLLETQSNNDCLNSSLACIVEKSIDDDCPEVESALASSICMEVSGISVKSNRNDGGLLETSAKSSDSVCFVSKCSSLVRSDVSLVRISNQSESLLAGDLYDAVSPSYSHLELPNHRRRKAVSYSGKSTAAILQELLMALNSTNTKKQMADGSGSKSSSKFNLYPQFGGECEDSASSAVALQDDLKKNPLASIRQTLVGDEWRQISPISTLEFPYSDDSTTVSDVMDDAQERKLLSRVCAASHHQIFSRRHHVNLPAESKSCTEPFKCEEQYVKNVVKTANLSPVDVYAAKLRLPCTVLSSDVFNDLEDQFDQQWEWGIMPDEKMLAKCRSETDVHFTKSFYAEAGIQNRKLVFECVHESLNMQLGINRHHPRQSPFQSNCTISQRHISQIVCKQMEVWRSMACCMNIDDIVEQEMNTGVGKWDDFVDEMSDCAVEMESCIVQSLIDELMLDVSRRLYTSSRNPKEFNW